MDVDQYHRKIFYLLVDRTVGQLQDRFQQQHLVIGGLYLIPKVFIFKIANKTMSHDDMIAKVVGCARFIQQQQKLLHDISLPLLKAEVQLWFNIWHGRFPEGSNRLPPTTIQECFDSFDFSPDSFPQIVKVLVHLATLPVTTCTCERSFSMMRIVKTYLRSTMTNERLNDVCMLHAAGDMHSFTDDEIVRAYVGDNKSRGIRFGVSL